MSKKTYSFYPDIDDPDFYKKIYVKKEFNQNKIDIERRSFEQICSSKEFKLLPQQKLLKNYLSINTPYNGLLVFHGTGVGKTCTAVSIAEGFKDLVTSNDKRILIIVSKNIQDNFKKELYDPVREETKKKRDDIVQCTGLDYELIEQSKYLTQEQKYKKIRSMINSKYEFFGYGAFANEVKRLTDWDGKFLKDGSIPPIIRKIINYKFRNRIIIIDEAHNIKKSDSSYTKTLPIIKTVIKYAKNTKLILMTATPMYNQPNEIVELLNLLLLNDNRPLLKRSDLFNNKEFTKDGEELLKKACKGYVSYLRGEKPPSFPFRLYPDNFYIPKPRLTLFGEKVDNNIKYLRLYECPMNEKHFKFYNTELQKYLSDEKESNDESDNFHKNEIINEEDINEFRNLNIQAQKTLVQITNIVYPLSNKTFTYGKDAYKKKDDGSGSFVEVINIDPMTKRKSLYYKYQKHTLHKKGTKDEKPMLHYDMIGDYSSKIKTILDNVFESKGIIFIYSDYIYSGILPIALALEQNGFKRYTLETERQLLEYDSNPQGGGGKRTSYCYLCGKDASNIIHNNTSNRYEHKFKQAKYILLSGSADLSKIEPGLLTKIINSNNNPNGEIVKVLLATSRAKEGLDLKKIRQINIMEPWYNLSRIEQIIGRGIRHKSHCGLSELDRNVEIFLLCSSMRKYPNELIDQFYYRLSENKDLTIKKIERVLKQASIDCNFNKYGNIIKDKTKVKQVTSKGRNVVITFDDKPYSKQCDYSGKCEYKCVWEPDKTYPLDTDTYTLDFAKDDINIIKSYIKYLYRKNYAYTLDDILTYVKKKNNLLEDIYIYKTIDLFLNDSNTILYDKYDREGKLILRGNYYIYQPNEIKDERIPMYYRDKPLKIKNDSFTIIDKVEDVKINKNKNNKNNTDIKKIYEDMFKKYSEYNPIIILKYILDRVKNLVDILKSQVENLVNETKDELTDMLLEARLFNLFIYKNEIIEIKKISNTKNELIGIKLDDKYIYYENNNWYECDNTIIKTYKNKQIEKDHNDIYGVVKSGNFKIVDLSKFKNAYTVNYKQSKRSIITGRNCSTFQIKNLNSILSKLNISISKIKKNDMCIIIELKLRELNLNNKKIYFDEN